MGTQQLLLIVLCVIIIGITISTGISMVQKQSIRTHQQDIKSTMNSLMIEAMVYKRMPYPIGGGSGTFRGFYPVGADPYNAHVSAAGSSGALLVTPDVNYFIECWAEGSYPQRVKIIASSKLYGQGNYWSNTLNSRITASYDTYGKIINNSTLKGFEVSGKWK